MSTDVPTGDNLFADRLTDHLDARADGIDHVDLDLDADDAAIFSDVVGELRSAPAWSGPPAGLRDALFARIAEEEAQNAAEAPAPIADPVSLDARRMGRSAAGRSRRRWAVPAVAAAVAALVTMSVLAVERALEPRGETYAAAGTPLAPEATATVAVLATPSGFKITLASEGLPAAAPGSYYAAWLRGPAGTVPLGSFHSRRTGAPIALWSGVDPAAYPEFFVTLQAEGDPPAPSGPVVITATLRR